jgi:hypothetical protein
MVGMAIMGVACAAFAGLLKYVNKTTMVVQVQGEAQEEARLALSKIEGALIHANEVRVASATFTEFVVDLDRNPDYDPNGDVDGDGTPNFRDADRDGDAALLTAATAQWRVGFNLKDDDEDGDSQIDVVQRIYFSGGGLWFDMSLNGASWDGPYKKIIAADVSTFTLTYWGNKANALGKNIDLNGDGIISSSEMDAAIPTAGMGNSNGALDIANERRYITTIRINMGIDRNKNAQPEYAVETDVYPPLLPLKSQ